MNIPLLTELKALLEAGRTDSLDRTPFALYVCIIQLSKTKVNLIDQNQNTHPSRTLEGQTAQNARNDTKCTN